MGPSWRPLGAVLAASWGRLGGLGGVLGRLGPSKNRCQNRSKISCLLGSVLVGIRVDFGKKNGAKLVPKWDPTWGSLKIRKKPIGASPLAPIEVWRVQVGSQNPSKIDQKMKSTWEGLTDSIFSGFLWIWRPNLGPSWEGKSSQDRTRQDKTGERGERREERGDKREERGEKREKERERTF